MKTISGITRGEVWLEAADYLEDTKDWEEYNLILEIDEPTASSEAAKIIEEEVDSFLGARAQPLFTVAETIFPAWMYKKYGIDGVYNKYPEDVYPLIKNGSWGTYAHRLLRHPHVEDFNPLEECIKKLNNELSHRGTKRACYELNMAEPGVDLPTYQGPLDNGRRPGGPCLSHLSFKIGRDRRLYLTVLYRNHFYIERTLGNLLGLARLQQFVADQTGLEVGPLVCVSTLANLDTKNKVWGKQDIRDLLSRIRGRLGSPWLFRQRA